MNDLESLIDALREYAVTYPAERTIASGFFSLLEAWPRVLGRTHFPGHLTASAWVLDRDGDHVVLLHHRKLGKWLQPGGHADGNADLPAVALKELKEEAGVPDDAVSVVPGIFDIDIHDIPAYGDTPEHQHFDIRFLVESRRTWEPRRNDESHEVRWHALDSVAELTTEESIRRMVEKSRYRR